VESKADFSSSGELLGEADLWKLLIVIVNFLEGNLNQFLTLVFFKTHFDLPIKVSLLPIKSNTSKTTQNFHSKSINELKSSTILF
jgi:hypothetical protein